MLITLLGGYLRFRGLFANTFHADEALFGMWARYIAVWRDPLLFDVPTPVDKPPLLFYLQALFYPLQGAVEWAARLPNFFASILLIPLTGRIAFRLTFGDRYRSWLAAGLVALSPLAIQFSATAFTDPLLTFLVMMALWHAIQPTAGKRVMRSAGLWLGLAFLTKYQAILFLPLIIWLESADRKSVVRSLVAFGGCVGLLLVWDWVPNGQIDLFGRQLSAYGGIHLSPLVALPGRFTAYFQLFTYMLGTAGSILLAVWFVWAAVHHSKSWGWTLALQLGGFIIAYFLLHVAIETLIEPRYLLPLVPLLAIWVVTAGDFGQKITAHIHPLAALIILTAILAPPAFMAQRGEYPFGGRPSNDDGAAAIAQTIIDEPYGTVLYDHWYSWHWRYHFFYKGVYVEWFEDEEDLLENLTAFYDPAAEQTRYLALRWYDPMSAAVQTELESEGYRLELVAVEGRIELYAIRKE